MNAHGARQHHAPFAAGLSASLMALAVAALTACGAAPDEAALSGYAEAELVYLASSIPGTPHFSPFLVRIRSSRMLLGM